jgi:hypothetical protein
MSDVMVLLAPSGNRVYAGTADDLMAAELAVLLQAGGATARDIEPTSIAGVAYLRVASPHLDPPLAQALGLLSGFFAAYEHSDGRLTPVAVARPDLFDNDLVTIPKYPGKTNEQFTRLLLNVTLASVRRDPSPSRSVLDPLCGRGTTLSTGLLLGHEVSGIEGDLKSVEAYAAFLKTYLRRKRLKHTADMVPVRREGKALGRRLDLEVRPAGATAGPLRLIVYSGDTRQSASLYGKRRFDAVVTDAPYGVVHGSHSDVRGVSGKRDRSPAGLLREAIPVWSSQLRSGGALGLSWNTYGLSREDIGSIAVDAGLTPLSEGPYLRFGHRVDAGVYRDVFVAVKA